MLRRLRLPLVHFVAAGSLLFALQRWVERRVPSVVRAPIVISARQVAALDAEHAQRWGQRPTPAELDALVDQAVEDEVLYREARALRLDAGDERVRARLIQKMRAVSDDPTLDDEALYRAALSLGLDDDLVIRRLLQSKMRLLLQRAPREPPPSQAELAAYLETHRDRFAREPALSLRQVFFSPSSRGAHLDRDARAALHTLRTRRLSREQIAEMSDPFALGLEFPAIDGHEMARFFGEEFAREVERIPPGAWSGPIHSPFGTHLVQVERVLPAEVPSLEAVRQQITRAVLEERAVRRLREALTRLRGMYAVQVERGAAPTLATARAGER